MEWWVRSKDLVTKTIREKVTKSAARVCLALKPWSSLDMCDPTNSITMFFNCVYILRRAITNSFAMKKLFILINQQYVYCNTCSHDLKETKNVRVQKSKRTSWCAIKKMKNVAALLCFGSMKEL